MKNLVFRNRGFTLALLLPMLACGSPSGDSATDGNEGNTAEEATAGKPAAVSRPVIPRSDEAPESTASRAPTTVGANSGDFTLQAPSGTNIYTATGSFPTATFSSENDNSFGVGSYSIQLNTNTFTIDPNICFNRKAGTLINQCLGWEQFVYQNDQGNANVFIQYWLINTGISPCPTSPSAWTPFTQKNSRGVPTSYCFFTESQSTTAYPISNLAKMSLSGTVVASDGLNHVTFSPGDGTSVSAKGPDIFSLSTNGFGSNGAAGTGGWEAAEFNVFGTGDGSVASFPSGSSFKVNLYTLYGDSSTDADVAIPSCGRTSFTGETNNTSLGTCTPSAGRILGGPRGPYVATYPSITFTESTP